MVKQSKSVYVIGSIIIGIVTMLGIFAGLIFGGVLDSTPGKLVITSASFEKVYDGTELVSEKWDITSGELKKGHVAKVTCTGSQVIAGASKNTFDVTILDSNGADVTSDYEIVKNEGTLTVAKRTVELLSDSDNRDYNGEELTKHGYTSLKGSFVTGHVPVVEYTGAITEVGKCENVMSVTVNDAEGNDVTPNYDLIVNYGTLEVKPIEVTIKTFNYGRAYNGTALMGEENGYEFVSGEEKMLENDVIKLTPIASLTTVGACDNTAIANVYNGDDDVSSRYDITVMYGRLSVDPKSVAFKTLSDQKYYDGTPLTKDGIESLDIEYNAEKGKWIITFTGEEFVFDVTGTITKAGRADNTVDYYVLDKNGVESTSNYQFNLQKGVLVVDGYTINVKTNSDEKFYDGTPLTKDGIISDELFYDENEGKWIIIETGDEFVFDVDGTITEAGQADNTVDYYVLDKNGVGNSDNYIVHVDAGTLTIKKREITIATNSDEKVYDGTPLTKDGIVSGDVVYDDTQGKWVVSSTGEEFTFTVDGTITNAGEKDNTVTFDILNASGQSSKANYDVNVVKGTLTITKIDAHLVTGTFSEEYGTTLYSNPTGATLLGVLPNHEFTLTAIPDYCISEVGSVENKVLVSITENGESVLRNYNIIDELGNLEIRKRQVTITTGTGSATYNGKGQSYEVSSMSDSLLDGHVVVKESLHFISVSEAGTYENSVTIDEIVIVDPQGNPVTKNYEILKTFGLFTINEKLVHIKVSSANKPYDGTPLTCEDVSYPTEDCKFIEGHEPTFIFGSSRTEVGTSLNQAVVYKVFDQDDNEISLHNYEFHIIDGELTVYENLSVPDDPDDPPGPPGWGGKGTAGPLYKVKTNYSGTVYLKSNGYGDYLYGASSPWGTAPVYTEPTNITPLHYGYQIYSKSQSSYNMSVEKLNSSVSYAFPYYTDFSQESIRNDVDMSEKTDVTYSLSYIPWTGYPIGVSLGGTPYYNDELLYRDHVYANYLSLPTQTRTLLNGIISNKGFNASDPTIVNKVANFISKYVKYNAEVGLADYDGDKVEYFFTQAEEGRCECYATAATVLYRALGIPARAILGVKDSVTAGVEKIIQGANAHAWVEVYLNGFGWVPVEVTGSGGGGGGGIIIPEPPKYSATPHDILVKYDDLVGAKSITYNLSNLKLSNQLTKLIEDNDYTYEFTVSGIQNGIGKSNSQITSFILYDKNGNDITANYDIETNQKGLLHIYVKEISLKCAFTYATTYTGKAYELGDDVPYTLSELLDGHTLSKIKFAVTSGGINAGKYSVYNSEILIVDGAGNDVTDYYKINKTYGTLTVKRKAIIVEAGSETITYEQLLSQYLGVFTLNPEDYTNELGHTIKITTKGEVTGIGSADNVITDVKIVDENGDDVTENYVITAVTGKLRVVPPS